MSLGPELRLRETVRWAVFAVISIGIHASLLMTSGPRTDASSSILDAAFERNGVEVRLRTTSTAPETRASVESGWVPLKTLPVATASNRRPRMLDFIPAQLVTRDIDESLYLPISRVTLRPSPVRPIAVPYPRDADATSSMAAKIVVLVDEDGSVAKVSLAKDQRPSPFAFEAQKTFEKARYQPALVDGRPVKVRLVIVVNFEDHVNSHPRGVTFRSAAPTAISTPTSVALPDQAK